MGNNNEMKYSADSQGVDAELLVTGISELLEGIRHCLKAADLDAGTDEDGHILMIAARPGKGIEVRDVDECFEVLKCFGDTDTVIQDADCGLLVSYDERQVFELDGKKYLAGPAIFYDVDQDGEDRSVTAEDIYEVQRVIARRIVTLCADGKEFPAFLLKEAV